MTMAKCPLCGGLYGPLAKDLLLHLRDAHGLAVEWYDATTGNIKLAGWLPGVTGGAGSPTGAGR